MYVVLLMFLGSAVLLYHLLQFSELNAVNKVDHC